MKKKFVVFIALGLAFVAACNSQKSEEVAKIEALKEEVIAVHDEAMARMGEIMQLKKQLQTKAEADTTAGIRQTIQNLEAADAAMMDWMRNFKFQLTEDTNEAADTTHAAAKIEYLQQEKEKMKTIDQKMVEAIEAAKQELSN